MLPLAVLAATEAVAVWLGVETITALCKRLRRCSAGRYLVVAAVAVAAYHLAVEE